jgi:dTDP-4-amino-4,6-dideoxygalactose transaminase
MIDYENLQKLNSPFLDEYRERFEAVLAEGYFILGQQVIEFERSFADYCGTRFCIGVANGLDAIAIALKAFDFQPGSEVIVPSNTYIATILAVIKAGLKPVLVEPDIKTYNIAPEGIETAISSKTVAVVAVHLYGRCCEMDRISEVAKRHNLKLVEDCAQAHGAKFKNKKAGSFGDIGAFSFYPTKNLGALGDGGCLTTDAEALNEWIKKFRHYGSEKKGYNEIAGENSRLDELQAAFLNVKLKHLDTINAHKRKLASRYNLILRDDFVKPEIHPDYDSVYYVYNIRHPKRDAIREFLLNKGIRSEIHYPVPPHRQRAMQGILKMQEFPVSETIHATTLSLPISFHHREDEIERIADMLNSF